MILTMIALEYSWTGSSSPHAVLAGHPFIMFYNHPSLHHVIYNTGVTRTLSSHDETQPASHKLQVPS